MWSRNKANLYIRDALDDFHYDPKALPSPIAQRKIYRNKLMLTHLVGFGGGVSEKIGDVTSYALDGTGDYLSVPDHADWTFGNGNFVVELFVRFDSAGLSNAQPFYAQRTPPAQWFVNKNDTTHKLVMVFVNAGDVEVGRYTMTSNWAVSADQWYHLAFTRTTVVGRIFIDGVEQTVTEGAAFSTNTVDDLAAELTIGSAWGAAIDGYIDEIRISKGTDRGWTSGFTPPSSEYVSDANTALLIHGGEVKSGTTGSGATFTDSGNTGHTVTENGNAIEDTTIFKI